MNDNGKRKPRCLVLVDFETMSIGTVRQHVSALRDFSSLNVDIANVRTLNRLSLRVDRFDVIVFHYSIVIARGFHIDAGLRQHLVASKALKVLFIQDEYRWIDATAEAIRELGISVIFTVLNEDVVDKVYRHPWLKDVRKEITLTGFVDEKLLERNVSAYAERPIDVAYRARKVPFWLGSFAMEKWTIGEKFSAEAERFGLSCDISSDEDARLYGERWVQFLAGAKAVLGTESGASVCDFTGAIRASVDAATNRDLGLSFEAVRDGILQDNDGQVVIHVISPRIFEAAALKTLMINYPGEYSGRLVPWRHYVPLEKDHSNIEEVISVVRDPDRAQPIIDAAYREVACNPENSFRAMVGHFDRVVSEELDLAAIAGAGRKAKNRVRTLSAVEVVSWADIYLRRVVRKVRRRVWRLLVQILTDRARKWVEARFIT
jgi:hypothetical protein